MAGFNLKAEVKKVLKGDVYDDKTTRTMYSHDASLLEVEPKAIVFPTGVEDVKNLVRFVNEHKQAHPELSLTVRAAGTDMSGGPLNESIIVDVTRYIHGVKKVTDEEAVVLPGTFYRDFEAETLKRNRILPSYTASKNLCAIGGMIGNNSGGEKTLRYGKTEDYTKELKMVCSDGNEYIFRSLTKDELEKKMAQGDFEANLYKRIYELVTANETLLKDAKPKVSKNSAGYYLWNVWNGETFDLTKLIVGSQGTLGIVTEAKFKIVPVKQKSKLFVIFMKDLHHLSEVVNEILPFGPDSLESYDDHTFKMAMKFLPGIMKSMKAKHFFKLMFSFLPELWMTITGGVPKLMLLVEFSGDTDEEIDAKMSDLSRALEHFKLKNRVTHTIEEAQKYWTIRRESFNLLRQHVRGMRTAPFIDDVIVCPEYLPEFIPQMTKILDEYNMLYTIAGHAGDGNFHIIPLMNMHDHRNIDVITEVSEKVYDLVIKYKGSITAEHNDGIIRTPYLSKMYGADVYKLFEEVKKIFDPHNIFNPGKKVGCSIDYMVQHIVKG